MREIQLKDAKATLSAVVDQAVSGNPAIITRHGRKEAVILSFNEYEKLSESGGAKTYHGSGGIVPLRAV